MYKVINTQDIDSYPEDYNWLKSNLQNKIINYMNEMQMLANKYFQKYLDNNNDNNNENDDDDDNNSDNDINYDADAIDDVDNNNSTNTTNNDTDNIDNNITNNENNDNENIDNDEENNNHDNDNNEENNDEDNRWYLLYNSEENNDEDNEKSKQYLRIYNKITTILTGAKNAYAILGIMCEYDWPNHKQEWFLATKEDAQNYEDSQDIEPENESDTVPDNSLLDYGDIGI